MSEQRVREHDTDDEQTAQQLEQLLRRAAAQPDLISFAGGFPAAEAMPRESLAASASAVLLQGPDTRALQYGWPEGRQGLREWVAARLQKRGANIDADDVIITAGAQQALSLAAAQLLGEGDDVLVPPLCYGGALSLFRGLGANIITSANAQPPSCVYVMPGVENPSGHDTVSQQRDQLLALAAPIIADEAYGELRFDGRAPPLLLGQAARVFHVGGFSKTVSPGLRVGWLVAPKRESPRVLENKQELDLQACSLTQSMLLHWLRHSDYDAHVARITRLYRERAECLASLLHEHLPSWRFELPEGGFCLWVDTNEQRDEVAVLSAAVDAGVSYDPGSHFAGQQSGQMPLSLRLCFSNCNPDALREGALRLKKAWSCAGPKASSRARTPCA